MQDLLQDLFWAGVKWELSEDPIGFTEMISHKNVVPERTRTLASVVPPISPIIPMSTDTAIAMASRPTTLDALRRMILEFNHPLRAGTSNVVLPTAATNPNGVMIITDMPSSDDDACGNILSGGSREAGEPGSFCRPLAADLFAMGYRGALLARLEPGMSAG